MLQSLRKISIIHPSKEDKFESKKILEIYDTHYNDALHKVMSLRAGAEYFVTKNVRDFVCFNDINIKKPDEL